MNANKTNEPRVPGTDPALDDATLSVIRNKLTEREQELQAEVRDATSEVRSSEQGLRTEVGDEGDVGEARIRDAVRYAEGERDIEELRRIEAALERMTDGRYGECIDCGLQIPLARLKVEPAAERCIACQEAFEADHPTGPAIAPALSEPPPRR